MLIAHYYNQYGPADGWHSENSWAGVIFSLFFLVIIIAAAYFIIRAIAGNRSTSTDHPEPIDIAKERYAKGEISKDELSEIKKELK